MPASSFITPDELATQFDARTIGDLLSDAGERIDSADLAINGVLLSVIQSASSMVTAYAAQGSRYRASDLNAILVADGDAAQWLRHITGETTMLLLERRRGYAQNERNQMLDERVQGYMKDLQEGRAVFDEDVLQTAGTIDGTVGPTTVEIQSLNLIRDKSHRFYPTRAGRLPKGR